MQKIGLHDAEKDHMRHKTFPNYALMKISAYHKAAGDTVEWWEPLLTDGYDKIYSSKVFDFTPPNPFLPGLGDTRRNRIRGYTNQPNASRGNRQRISGLQHIP